MIFSDLGLNASLVRALEEQGYTKPSPIQEKAIPPALVGRDVLGCAQTGTGKTCAFAAPTLQRLSATPHKGQAIRALILTPTRELAIQIGESFDAYGKYLNLRHTVIFGGVGQNPQVAALKNGVDILIATPGRLMDLYQQGFIQLEQLEIFVLDEADRMLDMGFIHDVKKILKWLPEKKQTLFFSATMPPEITNLVNSLLKNPIKVAVDPVSSPAEAIQQSIYLVDKGNKTLLLAHLMEQKQIKNALVFTRTKHGANKVARDLSKMGISAAAIHGNKSQTARQQALADFKSGRIRCLVATDIAARGLDIEELSHVFNYNLPEVPETYIHRIGRTGRAGRGGEAIAFCDFSEKPLLHDIEKLAGRKIPLIEDHPYPMQIFQAAKRDKNGRMINEEDAEARAAARELRRQREESRQAAAQAKKQRKAAPAPAEPVRPKESKSSRPCRPEKKSAPEVTPLEGAAQTARRSAPPKRGVRPGALMDTGDSMPRTDFHRPNPLDSDVIMDATARLLAPRRTAQAVTQPRPSRQQSSGSTEQRRRKPAPAANGAHTAEKGQKPVHKATPSKSRRVSKSDHSAPPATARGKKTPAPAQPKKQGGKSKAAYQKRPRGIPQEPRRSQTKDSTEQPSLMKPYYLDIGR